MAASNVRYTLVCRELRWRQRFQKYGTGIEWFLKAVVATQTHDKLKCIGHSVRIRRNPSMLLESMHARSGNRNLL
jgi:hypothetical protein